MEPIILSAFLFAQIPTCPKPYVNAMVANKAVAHEPRRPCKYMRNGAYVFYKGARK